MYFILHVLASRFLAGGDPWLGCICTQPRSPQIVPSYVNRLSDQELDKLLLSHGVLLLNFHGTGLCF
jgi:hypothetical protein